MLPRGSGALLLVALLLAAAAGEGRGVCGVGCERRAASPANHSRARPPPPHTKKGTAAAAKPRLTTTADGRVVNEKGADVKLYGVNWFGFNTE
jgi:hypothetical protein